MKQYRITAIYEDDYGCEERGPEQETQVLVVLWDGSGLEQTIRQADAWLLAQDINEGDWVSLSDGKLMKNE